MKELRTDNEFEKALEKRGYRFHDNGDSFSIEYVKTGSRTKLEAIEMSDALFEAWNLVKPE